MEKKSNWVEIFLVKDNTLKYKRNKESAYLIFFLRWY